MAEIFTGRNRIRKRFGHIQEVAKMPNLIEVQKSSYEDFLMVREPAGGLDSAALRHLAQALAEADAWPDRALLLASSQGRDAVPGAPPGHLIRLPDRPVQG